MITIVHIITGLGNGGAEMMLYKLLSKIDRKKYNIEVISLTDKGIMGPKMEELGIIVHELNLNKKFAIIANIKKGIKLTKRKDIIQSWMYHADLFATIISIFVKPKKLIWGIRRSNLEKDKNKKLTLLIVKINSYLSKFRIVDKIVSCSQEATNIHKIYGYSKDKIITIPNGFSIEKYKLIDNARYKIQNELKIDDKKLILSIVGRWDILKDHKNALDALKILKRKRNDFIMIFCGTQMDENNKELVKLIRDKKLENIVKLLGRREDIPNIMSATDIYISSSSGEGFSNVIGEAMACETFCIVTDVGDSSYIVGHTGETIPRENPEELSKKIDEVMNMDDKIRREFAKKARERIIKNFEIKKIVSLYEKLYI